MFQCIIKALNDSRRNNPLIPLKHLRREIVYQGATRESTVPGQRAGICYQQTLFVMARKKKL